MTSLETYYATYISEGGTDAEWRSMCKRSRKTTSVRNPHKRGEAKGEWYWLQWREYFTETEGVYAVDLSKLPKTHRQRYRNVRKWLIAGDKKKSYEGEQPAYKFDREQWSYLTSIPGLFEDLNTEEKCDAAFAAYMSKPKRTRRSKSTTKSEKKTEETEKKSEKKSEKKTKKKSGETVKKTKKKSEKKAENKAGETAKKKAKRGRPSKQKLSPQAAAKNEMEQACVQSVSTEENKIELSNSTSVVFSDFKELEVEDIELDRDENIFASDDDASEDDASEGEEESEEEEGSDDEDSQ